MRKPSVTAAGLAVAAAVALPCAAAAALGFTHTTAVASAAAALAAAAYAAAACSDRRPRVQHRVLERICQRLLRPSPVVRDVQGGARQRRAP